MSLFSRYRHSLRSARAIMRGAWGYMFGRKTVHHLSGLMLFTQLRIRLAMRMPKSLSQLIYPDRARLWTDKQAIERILQLLRQSQHSIVIQIFIWREDEIGARFARAVVHAADHGVAVRITKDAVGDVFEIGDDFVGTRKHKNGIWYRLWNHPNIAIEHVAHGNHAKVFLIDHNILLLTGMNIGNEYYYRWHDYMVELRGASFVERYLHGGDDLGSSRKVKLLIHGREKPVIRTAVVELLRSAQKSIVLEQAYIADTAILDLLIERSKEGIEVLLILPTAPDIHNAANMHSVQRLLREADNTHLRVLLFPEMVHGKIILVDNTRAFIGSANLITSSLDDMGEVNVLFENEPQDVILKLRRVLLKDMIRSRSLTDPPYFPIVRRLLAWLKL